MKPLSQIDFDLTYLTSSDKTKHFFSKSLVYTVLFLFLHLQNFKMHFFLIQKHSLSTEALKLAESFSCHFNSIRGGWGTKRESGKEGFEKRVMFL